MNIFIKNNFMKVSKINIKRPMVVSTLNFGIVKMMKSWENKPNL
jgi:hypothetical protein